MNATETTVATDAEINVNGAAPSEGSGESLGVVAFSTAGMNDKDAKQYADFMSACNVKGKPKQTSVAVASVYSQGNPRENLNIRPLVISIMREGFRINEPLMLAEMPDGRYLAIRGNRRYLAADWIRRNRPEDFTRIFGKDGKIPAIVYHNLGETDIEILRQDFDDKAGKQGLSLWETFLAVKGLVRVGLLSEAAIAARLGRYKEKDGKLVGDRSFIQPLVNLSALPPDVQTMFRPVLERPEGWDTATGLRKAAIMRLAKVYRESGEGETFRAALATEAEIKEHGNKGKKTDATDPTPAYGATVKSLMERLNSFNSETVRAIVDRIAKGQALTDIDDALTVYDAVKASEGFAALAATVKAAPVPADDADMLAGVEV